MIVELKNKYPKMLVMAVTPYTNAQTIVQAVRAGIESHIKKECSAVEIKDAFNLISKNMISELLLRNKKLGIREKIDCRYCGDGRWSAIETYRTIGRIHDWNGYTCWLS